MRLSWLNIAAATLVVVGALNWGAVGLFNFNLVRSLFGSSRAAERTIYGLVGLAGLLMAISLSRGRSIGITEGEVYGGSTEC